ncbi:MAG: HEAT repeat domain-containing protein [Tsuneonella suprasediminis]|nr:HEAT repeat domain-containing protein [Altererythrobacter sp. N1]
MIFHISDLAMLVIAGSVAFALVMVVQMIVLLVRRYLQERRVIASRPQELAVLRELMKAVAGAGAGDIGEAPAFLAADPAVRLRAITHVLQMVRGADREALLRIADQTHVYDAALKDLNRGDRSRRVDALRVLEQIPSAASTDAMLATMGNDPSHDVRLEAATALARTGNLPKPTAVARMLELRARPLTRLHEALFRSSAVKHTAELERMAADEKYVRIRHLLVEALGWSGDFGVLDALERHSSDPNPEVRCAALKSARRLEHPGAARWAIGLLLDPVDAVRIQAVQTCAKLNARDAVPILSSLISSSSWWVRTRAKEALDKLRPEQRVRADITGLRL